MIYKPYKTEVTNSLPHCTVSLLTPLHIQSYNNVNVNLNVNVNPNINVNIDVNVNVNEMLMLM